MGETESAVSAFLTEFKLIVTEGSGLYVVNRTENRDSLVTLGITEAIRRREILSLSVADYCAGPEEDRDRPGEVWIFGKTINDAHVYIKLKIAGTAGVRFAKCISFHVAEYPLRFPLREK